MTYGQALLSDARHGVRVLAAAPAFLAVAVVVMALGIGATVSVFSVVNAVLLRSLPFGHPEKLVYLWSPNRNFKGVPDELGPNIPDFYDWQHLNHSFSSMALFRQTPVNLVSNGSARRIGASFVTGSFFHTLEAAPHLGRTISGGDDRPGHEHVAVISHALWRSEFHAEADILGKRIQVNRQFYTLVGVMPKEFGYPFDGDVPYEHYGYKQTDIWLPAAYTAIQKSNRENFDSADAIGRLRSGISPAAAQAELDALEARLNPLYPEMWRGWTVLDRPVIQTIVGPVEKLLWLLLGAVGVVFLIAIGNVANLLLARATARAHELAIRAALGADRWRIIRQLVTESLALSSAGGAFGVALAYAAVRLLVKLDPGNIPRFDRASVDIPVLIAAVLVSIVAGILSGLAPAISASKANVNELLKKAGNRIAGTSSRSRFALIGAEVALSMILLTASGLLIRSYLQLTAVNPGFSPATLTFSVNLDERYNTPEKQSAFYKLSLEKLRNMHGVCYAGAATELPLTRDESVTFGEIRGYGRTKQMIENRGVTPDYRKALGAALLRGRDFSSRDLNANVVMVNQAFATEYFPKRDPIGGQIRLGIGDLSKSSWRTVIGVTGNLHHNSLEEPSEPQVMQPVDNAPNFALSCSASTNQVIAEARVVLHSLDPVLTLDSIRTMRERIEESNTRRTFETTLLTGFAILAILLALAGLYAAIAYTVKQRTTEIGVRVAVGASQVGVVSIILSQGLRLTTFGLLIGLAGAFAVTRLFSSWLFGVKPTDPLTFLTVPLLVLVVACIACVIPAWSASRIDPVHALRQE